MMHDFGMSGWTVVAVVAAGAAAPAVGAEAAAVQRYDLPAQDLGAALQAIARTSGTSVLAPGDLVRGRRAGAVVGTFDVEAALALALVGSGLHAERVASGFVVRPDRGGPAGTAAEADGILVTGTRIRGGPVASTLIVQSARDFQDQGRNDLGEVVRNLPQSYGGGQNPGVGINVPSSRGFDVGGAASINLRGLGSDATLTLLDGRRLSFSGALQSIDVSAIPIGAVERLEIVPDGASAIYGSDAVAGVANIILRRKFDGMQVSARLGGATDGGDFQQQYAATGGTSWRGGSLVAAYEYGSNTAITAAQRAYAEARAPGLTLFPAMRHHSATLVGEQALTERLTFDADALFNVRWSDTTFPTLPGGDLNAGRASLSTKDQSYAFAPRLRLALAGDWRISLSGTIGKQRVDYRQTQCALADCSVTGEGYYRNTERAVELGGDGTLFALPGGDAKLALGTGYRGIGFQRFAVDGATVNAQRSQDSYYAYGEIDLPIVGPAQGLAFVDRLTATGALRYERYPGLAGVATPKLGLIYAATPDFDLKASWGKSFRAPTLYQQYQPRTVVAFPPDAIGGTGYPDGSAVLLVVGGNPALKPERATTWSTSLALHPRSLDGARLEISYFHVDYRDRIVSPIPFLGQALSNPLYAAQITPNPSAALQAALIAGAGSFVNATGAPYDPATIAALVDNGSVNAGRQTARGVDVLAAYRVDLGAERTLSAAINVSYLDSAQQLTASQPTIPLAGRIFSPPNWRGQGSLVWTAAPLTLAATLNYAGSVLDARTTTPVRVGGMTTLDLTGRIRFDTAPPAPASGLGGLELTLSVSNLFNARPSPIATTLPYDTPYDSTNASPVGRLISVGISKRF